MEIDKISLTENKKKEKRAHLSYHQQSLLQDEKGKLLLYLQFLPPRHQIFLPRSRKVGIIGMCFMHCLEKDFEN
jgi:hypothetical protein